MPDSRNTGASASWIAWAMSTASIPCMAGHSTVYAAHSMRGPVAGTRAGRAPCRAMTAPAFKDYFSRQSADYSRYRPGVRARPDRATWRTWPRTGRWRSTAPPATARPRSCWRSISTMVLAVDGSEAQLRAGACPIRACVINVRSRSHCRCPTAALRWLPSHRPCTGSTSTVSTRSAGACSSPAACWRCGRTRCSVPETRSTPSSIASMTTRSDRTGPPNDGTCRSSTARCRSPGAKCRRPGSQLAHRLDAGAGHRLFRQLVVRPELQGPARRRPLARTVR